MLHLVTAWRTYERKGDPTVLYCGLDAAQAQKAAANPPADALRLERGFVPDSFKQQITRKAAVVPAAPLPIQPAAISPVNAQAETGESSAESIGLGEDGMPQLLPALDPAPAKPSKR